MPVMGACFVCLVFPWAATPSTYNALGEPPPDQRYYYCCINQVMLQQLIHYLKCNECNARAAILFVKCYCTWECNTLNAMHDLQTLVIIYVCVCVCLNARDYACAHNVMHVCRICFAILSPTSGSNHPVCALMELISSCG